MIRNQKEPRLVKMKEKKEIAKERKKVIYQEIH